MDFGIGDIKRVLDVIEGLRSDSPLGDELKKRMVGQINSILFKRIIYDFKQVRSIEELLCDIILEKTITFYESSKKEDQEFRDPISRSTFIEPVTLLKSGRVYDRAVLEHFFGENGYIDPLSGKPLDDRERKVVPTFTMKSRQHEYFEKFYNDSVETIEMCFKFLQRPYAPSVSSGMNVPFMDLSTQDYEKKRFELLGYLEKVFDLGNEYDLIKYTTFFKYEEKFYRSIFPHKMYKLIYIRKKQFDILLHKKSYHSIISFYKQKVVPILRQEDSNERKFFLELIYNTLLISDSPISDNFLNEILQFYRLHLSPDNRKSAVEVIRRSGLSRSFDYVLLYVDMLSEEELFGNRILNNILEKMCGNETSKKSMVLQRCLQRDPTNTNLLQLLMDLYFKTPIRQDQEGFVFSQVFRFIEPSKIMYVLLPQIRKLQVDNKELKSQQLKINKENIKLKKRISKIESFIGMLPSSGGGVTTTSSSSSRSSLIDEEEEEMSPISSYSSILQQQQQINFHQNNSSYSDETDEGVDVLPPKKKKKNSHFLKYSNDHEQQQQQQQSSLSFHNRRNSSKKKKKKKKRGKKQNNNNNNNINSSSVKTFADLVRTNNIYVYPIQSTTTKKEISSVFKKFGPITKIQIEKEERYARIDFYNEEGVKKVMKNKKNIKLLSKSKKNIKISYEKPLISSTNTSQQKQQQQFQKRKNIEESSSSKKKNSDTPPYQQSVFIGGIPEQTSERELANVLNAVVGENNNNNNVINRLYGNNIKKGFAFVDFKYYKHVDELLRKDKEGIIINHNEGLKIDCYPIPKPNVKSFNIRLIGIPKYLGKQKIKKVILEQAGWIYGISVDHEDENSRIVKFVFRDDAENCLKKDIFLDNGQRISSEKA